MVLKDASGMRAHGAARALRHVAVAALAALLLLPVSSLASAQIRAYANPAVMQGLEVRPSTLTMAADGNDTITGLKWSAWGGSTARASGTNHVNNCVPNCAAGAITPVHVSVSLSSPGYYRGNYIYRCYAIKPAPAAFLEHFCLS